MSAEAIATLPTLGRPLVVLGVEFFAAEIQKLPDSEGIWVLLLLSPERRPEISGRIAAVREAEEGDLLDQADAALTVLSTRFGDEERRGDHFYAVNRALREISQVREIRASEVSL